MCQGSVVDLRSHHHAILLQPIKGGRCTGKVLCSVDSGSILLLAILLNDVHGKVWESVNCPLTQSISSIEFNTGHLDIIRTSFRNSDSRVFGPKEHMLVPRHGRVLLASKFPTSSNILRRCGIHTKIMVRAPIAFTDLSSYSNFMSIR